MKKENISTGIALLTSIVVVIGGWFTVRGLLNQRKTEIFARKGIVYELDSEIVVPGEDDRNHNDSEDFEGIEVASQDMAIILTVWESGETAVPHEPESGQMTMEQALEAGKGWIDHMVENRILPDYLSECSFDKTNAKMCTVETESSIDKRLLDYWVVTYKEGDVEISLTIHAASGQVWRSDISMNASQNISNDLSDRELVRAAFPFWDLENEKIQATVRRDEVRVNESEAVARMFFCLQTQNEKIVFK